MKDIDVAKALMEIKAKNPQKPVIGVFMTTSDFFTKLSEMDVNMPFFMYAEEAAEGLNRLNQQRIWQERPVGEIPNYEVDRARAEQIISQSIREGRDQLTTRESIDVLEAYGIRVCKSGFATNLEEVISIGNSIGTEVQKYLNTLEANTDTELNGNTTAVKSNTDALIALTTLLDKDITNDTKGINILNNLLDSDRND